MLNKLFVVLFAVLFFPKLLLSQPNTWRSTGGPLGGVIVSLCTHPTQANLIMAGTITSNTYLTIDGGGSWRKVCQGEYPFSTLILPTTPPTLCIGTAAGGIWMSSDQGENWRSIGNLVAYSLALDPIHPDVFAAGSDSGIVFLFQKDSVIARTRIPTAFGIPAVAFSFNDPNLVLAGTDGDGVFRSTDRGGTWTQSSFSRGSIGSIAFTSLSPSLVYAGGSTVLVSSDGGTVWQERCAGLPFPLIAVLAIDPLIKEHVYAGVEGSDTAGFYETTNSGMSWTRAKRGLENMPPFEVLTVASAPPRILLGTEAGLFVGNLDRERLKHVGVEPASIWAIAFDPSDEKTIYALGQGLWRSSDAGKSWIFRYDFRDGSAMTLSNSRPKKIFLGGTGITMSADDGLTWQRIGFGNMQITEVIASVANPHPIYAVGAQWNLPQLFLRSTTGGSSWDTISTEYGSLWSLGLDPTNSATLYCGYSFGILRSTDGGSHWVQRSDGLPQWFHPVRVVVNPSDPNMLYAAGWNTPPTRPGILVKSTDAGGSWFIADSGLGSIRLSSLSIDQADPRRLAVGSYDNGVFITNDAANSWHQINEGLESSRISSVCFSPQTGQHLYAVGTFNGGVWQYSFGVTSIRDQNVTGRQFSLDQNFPNPFNPKTRITFSVPTQGGAVVSSLRVYDILGREVATLLDAHLASGEYSLDFDGTSLPSGIYFYQLRAGNLIETKKLLLLK